MRPFSRGSVVVLVVMGWAIAAAAADCEKVFSDYETDLRRASELSPGEALDVLQLLLKMEKRHGFMCFGYYSRGRALVQERKALESKLEEAGIEIPRQEPAPAAEPGPGEEPLKRNNEVPATTRKGRQEHEQEQGPGQRQPSESSPDQEREEHQPAALQAKLIEKRPVKVVRSTAWTENLISTGVTLGGMGVGALLTWIGSRSDTFGLSLSGELLGSGAIIVGPSLGWWIRGGNQSKYGTYTSLARGATMGIALIGEILFFQEFLKVIGFGIGQIEGESDMNMETSQDKAFTGFVLMTTGMILTYTFVIADLIAQWVVPVSKEYGGTHVPSTALVPVSFKNGGKGLLFVVEF
ncbi:MAG: hypothetical protein GXP49_14890 [Deltaproteobacteria bacterium]|nr:hypothetical protein [Deltaproteobacteria bacterium]